MERNAAGRMNWAGNYKYSAETLVEPQSVEEVQGVVQAATRVKALGSRHSFNGIADTKGVQISTAGLQSIEFDPDRTSVGVGAGVRYGDLARSLSRQNRALHNLASLPHISIAGAVATGTHGSGTRNGNLATAVSAVELVLADGNRATVKRGEHDFAGVPVNLGALGVVTRLWLDLEEEYEVAQSVYLDVPFSNLEGRLADLFSAGYSVSLFTDWREARATQVWVKRRADAVYQQSMDELLRGAPRATLAMHPISGHDAEACTEQGGSFGPWFERLPHFRMQFTPSSGRELQSEYFVSLEDGFQAIEAILRVADRIAPLLLVGELRTVDADDLWLSPAYRRRSLALHFTWKPEWERVRAVLPMIEAVLEEFQPRPHWGKVFTLSPEVVAARFPRMEDFRSLRQRFDPDGKFVNDYLAPYV